MSYTELRMGKVRRIVLPSEWTDRDKIAYLEGKLGFTFEEVEYNDDGTFMWVISDEIEYIGGVFWEIIENQNYDDGEVIEVTGPNDDGTYNYILQWYNGGACFGEVLECALKKKDLL